VAPRRMGRPGVGFAASRNHSSGTVPSTCAASVVAPSKAMPRLLDSTSLATQEPGQPMRSAAVTALLRRRTAARPLVAVASTILAGVAVLAADWFAGAEARGCFSSVGGSGRRPLQPAIRSMLEVGHRSSWHSPLVLRARGGEGDFKGASFKEETEMLRQQMAVLVEEMRLLREALGGSESSPPLQAASAPAPVRAPQAEAFPPPARPTQTTEQRVAPPPTPVARQPSTPLPVESSAAAPASAGGSAAGAGTESRIKVVSAGHDGGNVADFFVDDAKIPIHGSASRRGLNVVIIDPRAKRVMTARTYDIWGQPQVENVRLAGDLMNVPEGHLALIALKDSGLENIDNGALAALRQFGSTLRGPLKEREGYLLIGEKGGNKPLAEQIGGRELLAEVNLPYKVNSPQPPPRPFSAGGSRPAAGAAVAGAAPRASPMAAAAAAQPGSVGGGTPPPWAQTAQAPVSASQAPGASVSWRPKIEVDPQGNLIGDDYEEVPPGAQSWREVAEMLGELEAKIRSRRLAGFGGEA